MIKERRRVSGPVLGVLFVAGLTAMARADPTGPARTKKSVPADTREDCSASKLARRACSARTFAAHERTTSGHPARPCARGPAIHTQVQLGERVPADVSLLPMPAAVLSDIPIVDSYLYFVTNEDVVLVAPDTREVVELIPKFDASGDYDQASARVVPQIVKPAPVPEPNWTPVIPPPGMPGGPPGPEPK